MGIVYNGLSDPTTLWYEETDPGRAGEQMVSSAKYLYQRQEPRRSQNLLHAKLYSNQDLSSIYDCGVPVATNAGVYLSMNVTESCVNTLTAKMTRTRIRPTLQTVKGSRSLQRKAEEGTDFIDGVYHANELHEAQGRQLFVDKCLFADNFAYVAVDDDAITVERVLPDEMIAEEAEALYGWRSLRTLYRQKYVHKQSLYRMCGSDGKMFADDPVKRAAIKNATGYVKAGTDWGIQGGQMVPVYFGWRLPSRKGAKDGRYIVAIEGATLFSKAWTMTRFPFAHSTFQQRPTGLWGRSLAEQLWPIQLKINEQIEVIDEGQRLNARVRIVHSAGAINRDEFDNELGKLIELAVGHGLDEVREIIGHGAGKEMYEDLETWIRRAYEVTGISMLSATAEKPEGISSAVALRELLDREDLRFSDLGKGEERFHRDIGELILEVAADAPGKIIVMVSGDKWVKKLNFDDLALEMDKMVVKVGAASALPTTPAARKQYADDLLERGAITLARYLEIIDEAGDVRGVTSLVTAVQESIDLDLEAIVDDGVWKAPERLRDPALARDTAIMTYAKVVHEAIPSKNLELLRRYILLSTRYAAPPMAPAAPMPAAPGADLGAATQGMGAEAVMPGGQPPAATPGPYPAPNQPPALVDANMVAPSPIADLTAAAPNPVPSVTPLG